jgi:hypothetical protein
MTEARPEMVVRIFCLAIRKKWTDAELQAARDQIKPGTRKGRRRNGRRSGTEPRPEIVARIGDLARQNGWTDAELQAVVHQGKPRTQRGRRNSKTYGRYLWGMYALVVMYRRARFTAAKQILSLAGEPDHLRENQSRALVHRFNKIFPKRELCAAQKLYAGYGPGMRLVEFYDSWARSRLPRPHDIPSATQRETELQPLVIASKGTIDAAIRNHFFILDKAIGASTFQSANP